MSTNSSTKRGTKRNSRDSNQSKIVVDLNSTPAEAVTGSSDQISEPPPPGVGGMSSALIDLEASDDDIQLLSSPTGFNQARNRSRRKSRAVIVVVDDEREVRSDPPGVPVTNSVHLSSLNRPNKRQRIPPNGTIINCESNSISEDESSAKRKKASNLPEKVVPEPKRIEPKEPTFSCPICMSTLISPCSTVCGHIFCEGCIKAAVQVKKQCPTCRAKLMIKKYFHKVFLPTATAD